MQRFFYIGLFLMFLSFLPLPVHAQDASWTCDFGNNILVSRGNQTCIKNKLYVCAELVGNIDDCTARDQNCWFTDFGKTKAQCFPKSEQGCAGSDGVLYRKGESWCDNGLLNVCNDDVSGKPTVTACEASLSRCGVVDQERKEARCIPPAEVARGCTYTGRNLYYPVDRYFCSEDNSKVMRCDGSTNPPQAREVNSCANNSCTWRSPGNAEDVTCSIGDPNKPVLDARQLEELQKQMTCGHIGQACCNPESWRAPQFRLPDFNIPGINIITNLVNQLFDDLGGPVYRFTSSILDKFRTKVSCYEGEEDLYDPRDRTKCNCVNPQTVAIARLCNNIIDVKEREACGKCVDPAQGKGLWTAIGCVEYDMNYLIANVIFGRGIGLAGVVAFFCIVYAAFILQTSAGDAQKVKRAQEMMTSCIMGLVLILFSIFILRVIGVNILMIPGFGT